MDARIPMSGNKNAFDAVSPIMNAFKMKEAMNQNALMDREMQERDALDAAYRESGGDINAMMQDPRVGAKTGMALMELKGTQAKAQKAAQVQDLDFMLKGAEYSAQMASAATNQQEWDAVRDQMVQVLGPEAAQRFPAQFSPEAQAQVVNGAMSFKDKLMMQREQRQQEQADRRFEQQQLNDDRRYALGERRIEAALSRGDGGEKAPKPIWSDRLGAFVDPVTMQLKVPVGADGQAIQTNNAKAPSPLSATEIKEENKILDAVAKGVDIGEKLTGYVKLLDENKVEPGLWQAAKTKAAKAGVVNAGEAESSMAGIERAALEARDAILTMAVGPQTDQDARRAYDRVMSSMNDKRLLRDSLADLKTVQERAVVQKSLEGAALRKNRGFEPVDYAGEYLSKTGRGGARALTGADAEAMAWAEANPNDPRSAAIIQKLGGR